MEVQEAISYNKGFIGNDDITLHKNKIITDEKQLVKLFNSYYVNIFERSSGVKPKTFGINFVKKQHTVGDIVNSYTNHPNTIKIKQVINGSNVSDTIFLQNSQ